MQKIVEGDKEIGEAEQETCSCCIIVASYYAHEIDEDGKPSCEEVHDSGGLWLDL